MGAHNNVHIPKESWPHWIWYAIEFGIVLAVSMLIAREITVYMLPDIAAYLGHADALEDWTGMFVQSREFQSLAIEIKGPIESMSNWIFYGLVGAIFAGWYLIIRGFILKKKILR